MAACTRLRHNRAMKRRLPAFALLPCVVLAACDAPAPRAPPAPVPALAAGDGSIQWQGRLPCADCSAIEVQLQLQRAGTRRDYILTEVYRAAAGDARFLERGQWRQQQALLHLRGSDGSRRVYALLPDGRLQPRDRHGRALLPRRDDDALVPVAATTAP
ncbi:hypothetical protein D0Y53_11520 [Luteimonas weifangensis]|uniref:Copper resistance protein NlpE n=2 Tax=Cognatiluteimonas weifangensis TaxID=2303539 RepID=A0A372DI13_9GAMM|nr:hypothetical protein D0Y53_11520 [Luteimonas weifangensis]